MTADSRRITNLTTLRNPNPFVGAQADDRNPAVSPDGTKIAFASNRDGDFDIYVMNAEGSNVRQLTTETSAEGHPAWSPDGTKIAFESNFDGDFDIYVMNADGSGKTNLTTRFGPRQNLRPAWSPDGKTIAYESNAPGHWELYRMDATAPTEARTFVRSTRATSNEGDVEFSPDGTKVAFVADAAGNLEIYVLPLVEGGRATRLTENGAVDGQPTWSPDGTKIAFSSNRDGDFEVFVMEADGTGQTQITSNTQSDITGDWQALSDLQAPTARALASTGRQGKTVRLRYRASDDTAQASVDIEVRRGRQLLGLLPVPLRRSSPTGTHSVAVKPRASLKGTFRMCVRAYDPSGNESPESCARLRITPRPKARR